MHMHTNRLKCCSQKEFMIVGYVLQRVPNKTTEALGQLLVTLIVVSQHALAKSMN